MKLLLQFLNTLTKIYRLNKYLSSSELDFIKGRFLQFLKQQKSVMILEITFIICTTAVFILFA